ncbi:MAG: hypothetical protein GY729_08595 [Desulfobacteraceae bacterium]|nr:hypothetical protein [Desulfobacteraceae bacterium]
MDPASAEEKTYLAELYSVTGSDLNAQASMYEVGANLGLAKEEAGTMAESLFIQGFAELKTLSGGIGITHTGLEALNVSTDKNIPDTALSLGTGPVLDAKAKKNVENLLEEIKVHTAHKALGDYPRLEQTVIDIKTIEIQMLAPNPKTGIIREVLKSLQQTLKEDGPKELNAKLTALISS